MGRRLCEQEKDTRSTLSRHPLIYTRCHASMNTLHAGMRPNPSPTHVRERGESAFSRRAAEGGFLTGHKKGHNLRDWQLCHSCRTAQQLDLSSPLVCPHTNCANVLAKSTVGCWTTHKGAPPACTPSSKMELRDPNTGER